MGATASLLSAACSAAPTATEMDAQFSLCVPACVFGPAYLYKTMACGVSESGRPVKKNGLLFSVIVHYTLKQDSNWHIGSEVLIFVRARVSVDWDH